MLATSTPYRIFLATYFALAVAIVIWNVMSTGRIVYGQRTPPVFAGLTALGALLLVPALIVTVSDASLLYGRSIQPLAWVWPAVTILFALQAIVALARRLVNPLFGIPVLAYDVIIAAVAAVRYMNSRGIEPPHLTLVLSAAQASALGVVGGTAALSRATWLLVPLLSPAFPSRSRLKRLIRSVLAMGVTVAAALVVMELPGAVETMHSYARYERDALQERPAGDFSFGLKIFPDLHGAPPSVAITNDLALADSLGVDAVSIVVTPAAARGRALDSLARVFDNLRADSMTLIVTLGYPPNALSLLRRRPNVYISDRLADVNRLTRALRPTIFIPAYEPYGEGARALGTQPPEFWIDYIRRAATIAHHVNPNIKIGVAAAGYGARDSALYAWAALRGSAVDIVGFSLLPDFDGAMSLDTHLRIARRWIHLYDRPKPHWVWSAGGYPVAHGEHSQTLALRGVLSWATAQDAVQGIVVTEAGDYDAQRGLRTPTGRLRPAFSDILRAITGERESAATQPVQQP